jgi:hypothetical protein
MADLTVVADSVRSNTTPFDNALRRYLFALDRLRSDPEKSDDVTNHLSDAYWQAEMAAMQEPAANLDELRAKADILWCDLDSIPLKACVQHFFADLIRLTGGGVSRAFDPASWLQHFERIGGGWVVRDDKVLLIWPEGEERFDNPVAELKMRAGRSAVDALILARHEGREA